MCVFLVLRARKLFDLLLQISVCGDVLDEGQEIEFSDPLHTPKPLYIA